MKKRALSGIAAALPVVFAIACSSSSSSTPSGATLGSACQADTDCAPSARGQVACFIGGQGAGVGDGGGGGEGGMGDGGGANVGKTWCSLKCTPDNQAQLCGPPFDGTCNMRGYCRLN